MKSLLHFLVLLSFGATSLTVAQTATSPQLVPRLPLASARGVVLTDGSGHRLFLLEGDSLRQLVSSAGCGTYHVLSADGLHLGFKILSSAGQAPALLNLGSGAVDLLHPPAARAGQVSFARNGQYGFTVGDTLVVVSGENRNGYDLGTYANIAPLSPDGNHVVFNDEDDQLYLLSLTTGARKRITDGTGAYALPQWSPAGTHLLFSSLGGDLWVYDMAKGTKASLGEGFGPAWSHDGRRVVFYRKTIVNDVLVNSDLFAAHTDGSVHRLTFTPDLCEVDPSFSRDDQALLFQSLLTNEIYAVPAEEAGVPGAARRIAGEVTGHAPGADLSLNVAGSATSGPHIQDIPYIHQVWDTPDWFNGHSACAPTTAVMLLAYYAVLPRWEVWCSAPSYHASPWGRYVCEQYSYRQYPFVAAAEDPNGTPSYGGYGFMWSSGSPRTTMAGYYTRHGLWAEQSATYPPHSAAVAEVEAGYPYSMCVGLTPAGHLILAHGIGTEPHTLLFNDPYGNKNLSGSGYPNPYGKNVPYDWPGYNNGNQNLQNVFWCIAVHAAVPAQADTLVDDLQLEHGFTLNTQLPSSMARWKDMNQGYGGHFWYCKTTGATDRDTAFATWQPTLPVAGPYEVLAHIQFSNATAARYRILGSDGWDTVVIDQKAAGGTWTSLGVHMFNAGTGSAVVLGDGATPAGQEIVFDALRFSYRGTATLSSAREDPMSERFALEQNYPNPFNPSTVIGYTVGDLGTGRGGDGGIGGQGDGGRRSVLVRLSVYDLLGREVAVLVNEEKAPGRYEVTFNGAGLASGVYYCLLEAAVPTERLPLRAVARMVLLQ